MGPCFRHAGDAREMTLPVVSMLRPMGPRFTTTLQISIYTELSRSTYQGTAQLVHVSARWNGSWDRGPTIVEVPDADARHH